MSATTDREDRKMVGTRVDEETHHEIRVEAAKADQSIAEYLRDLIDRDLSQ